MENLIKIKESDWHFKLIKFCWGIDPKMFKNLCPYFWLTIASLFVVLPVGFYKILIKKPFIKLIDFLDRLEQSSYEKWIMSLSPREITYLNVSNIYVSTRVDFLEKKLSRFTAKDRYQLLEDIKRLRPEVDTNDQDFIYEFREHHKEEEIKKERRQFIKAHKEAKTKQRINKVVNITKNFSIFLLVILVWAMGYCVVNFLTYPLVYLLSSETDKTGFYLFLAALGVAALVIGICALVEYLRKVLPGKVFKIIFFPFLLITWIFKMIFYYGIYKILIITVLGGICEGIGEGFSEFGGIFKDYLNSSYSDYCPGIEWKDKDEEK